MPSDHQNALELVLQLRSVIKSSSGGSQDLLVLHRIRDLCALATQAVPDLQSRLKLGELENYADALFSDRKRQRWARRGSSRVLALRHNAYAVLDVLERRLDYVMAAKRSGQLERFEKEA